MLAAARITGIAALIIIYAVLVHYVNATGQATALGAVLAITPILLIGLTMAYNHSSRLAGLVLLAITLAAGWAGWSLIRDHSAYIFWLEDTSVMLILLATFGRTLLHNRTPLCVTFARMVHGPLLPAHEHYARQVTVAWVIFFGLMATTSTLLFFLAPLASWSIFANFLTLPLVALMFIAEFIVRHQVLTDLPPGHILDAVRAYLQSQAGAKSSSP